MNRLKIIIALLLILFLRPQGQAQDQRVIRDVILLDRQPFEVLMSENGDILSKIRHLPDYLRSPELVPKQVTRSDEPLAEKTPRVKPQEIEDSPEQSSVPLVKLQPARQIVAPVTAQGEFKEYYEINFTAETATLSSTAISTLNELAIILNANPSQRVQVFGFQNESPLIAMLLSKRRRDACIAYLKIKGVRVDKQITRGSITQGVTNKIVFGLE